MKEIRGGYFPYCQFCKHDGICELKHHEFMGQPSAEKVDESPCPGHEDLGWHNTAFQFTQRANCSGRIGISDNFYTPLICECHTVISSLALQELSGGFCAKFGENEKGLERLKLAKKVARRKHIALEKVTSDDLPDIDENYSAVMTQ